MSHFNFGINYGFHYLQDFLIKKMGYNINLGEFNSNINSYLNANRVSFSNKDSTFIIDVDSLNIKYNGVAKLLGRKHIDYLKLKSPIITINMSDLKENNEIVFPKINFGKIIIDNAQINIIKNEKDSIKFEDFSGKISLFSSKKSVAITVKDLSFFQRNIDKNIKKLSAKLLIKNGIIKFKDLLCESNNLNIESEGKVKIESPNQFKIEVAIDRLNPDSLFKKSDSLFFENDVVDIFANLSGNKEKVNATMRIVGIFRGKIIDNLETEVRYSNKEIRIYSLSFINSLVNMNLSGNYSFDNNYNLKINLKNSYPSFMGISTGSLNVSGDVDINGNLKGNNFVNYDISCKNVMDGYIPRMYGKINISKNKIKLLDTNKVFFEDGHAEIHGEITKGKTINLFTEMHLNSFKNIPYLSKYDLFAKNIIHRNHIFGNLKSPNIVGRIYSDDINYKDYGFGSINCTFNLKDVIDQRSGEAYLNISNMIKGKVKIKSAESLIELSKDTINFNFIELRGDKGYMELSGKLNNYSIFNITNIYVEHSGNEIKLQNPFQINYSDDILKIAPFEFNINEGKLYGKLNLMQNNDIQSNVIFKNINIGEIFEKSKINMPISGKLSGAVNVEGNLNSPKITTIINSENGKINKLDYNRLIGNISYSDSTIFVNNFKLEDADEKTISIFGELPFYLNINDKIYDFYDSQPINLNIVFNDIELMKYNQFFPKRLKIGGMLTSILTVNGSYSDPTISFPIKIIGPIINKINLESAKINIQYSDKKLYLNDINFISKNGEYNGYGYFPMDLSLVKNNNILDKNDSIYFTITSEDNNLTYLTPFLRSVEQVNGNIFTTLTLNGTYNNPIRNGKIKIKDSDMTIDKLKNDIKNIDGNFILKDNIMDVDLEGSLFKSVSSIMNILGIEKDEYSVDSSNIDISGKMDMSKFFRPSYDLKIKGKDVNILTLSDDVDISGDMKLNVSGKDTITVDGVFQTNEGVLRIPFGSKTKWLLEERKNRKVKFEYEINVPMEQNIYLKNNFVDVELDGEVILKRDIDGNKTIGGELNIIDGFFYYYSVIFDVEYGKIIFDPIDGNHSLNFRAIKKIDDNNQIIAMLTGEVESPEIRLYDENNMYTQSELIQILTIGNTAGSVKEISGNLLTNIAEVGIEQQMNNLDIIQKIDLRTGTSLTDIDSTSVKIGSRLGKNIYFTIESAPLSDEALKSLELEYRINKNLSIVGTADEKSASGSVRLRFQY
ncbi:MAG: translocation/assembly module TamB domain-containing protein [Candidatus Marinimicrobia bacterium]|nr:translocation/assembly module TamB domain-containing protein [Candidatus Neomarinimicrobiota bacterium]